MPSIVNFEVGGAGRSGRSFSIEGHRLGPIGGRGPNVAM